MPTKNADLLKILQNSDGVLGKNNLKGAKDALDALLSVNLNTAEGNTAFRRAVIAHQKFWKVCTPKLLFLQQPAAKGYLESDNFLDPNQEGANFILLRQLATQQRVLLGLQNVTDDTLINILVHNPEECRAYLASKVSELGILANIPGWQPNERHDSLQPNKPDANKSVDILTEPAITSIKNQAVNLLLFRAVEKQGDSALLKAVVNATNKTDLDKAAKAIGFPDKALKDLDLPMHAGIKGMIDTKIAQADAEAKKNAADGAKAQFELYVTKNLVHTPASLLLLRAALEGNNPADFITFIEKYNSSFKHLDSNEIPWAKGLLGASYLKTVLLTRQGEVLPAINTADTPLFKRKLKTLAEPGEAHFIDALPDGQLLAIKTVLVKNLISTIKADQLNTLTKLYETKNLIPFKAEMKKLGLTQVEWMSDNDMVDIHHSLRNRAFELEVRQLATFEGEAHPNLLHLFEQLATEKQTELLKKPDIIRHLMSARDEAAVRFYLDNKTVFVDEIVKENIRVHSFSTIHNQAVADILLRFEPAIDLDINKVAAINQVLHQFSNDFSSVANYKLLVDNLKNAAGINHAGIYKAFDLTEDASAYIAGSNVNKNAIALQQTNNAPLRAADQTLPTKIVDFFRQLKKDKPLSVIDIKELTLLLNQAEKRDVFITAVSNRNPPADQALVKSLQQHLSASLFKELKRAQIQPDLLAADKQKFSDAKKKIREQLLEFQALRKPYAENKNSLKFIADVRPIDLFNPAYHGKTRADAQMMKAHYKELAAKCAAIEEQLKRNIVALQDYEDSLPNRSHPHHPAEITRLRQSLELEIQAAKEDLKFYHQVNKKLSGDHGILNAIHNSEKGTIHYIYQSEGLTCNVHRDDGTSALVSDLPSPQHSKMSMGGSNSTAYKLVEGSSFEYFDEPVLKDKQFKAQGRFTQTYEPSSTHTPNCTVTITQTPKILVSGQNPQENGRNLIIAKVKCYTDAAVALIAANGGKAPTKENPIRITGSDPEELNFLWTALVVLGEGEPRFGRDAIKVESTKFNPDSQLKWGGRFTDDSFYKQYFKQPLFQAEIAAKKEHTAEIVEIAMKGEANRKIAAGQMNNFKQQLAQGKAGNSQPNIDEEGPAPSPRR
jgi:hypothetical protein